MCCFDCFSKHVYLCCYGNNTLQICIPQGDHVLGNQGVLYCGTGGYFAPILTERLLI